MQASEPRSTPVESHLRKALDAAEHEEAKYHLREALQKVYLESDSAGRDRRRSRKR